MPAYRMYAFWYLLLMGGPARSRIGEQPSLRRGEERFLYSIKASTMGRLDKTKEGDPVAYRRFSPLGVGTVNARFWDPAKQWPCQQPTAAVGRVDGRQR